MQNKLIHEIRAVKSKKELANIIKAQRITEHVLYDVVKKLKVYARTGQAKITEIEVANFVKKSFVK